MAQAGTQQATELAVLSLCLCLPRAGIRQVLSRLAQTDGSCSLFLKTCFIFKHVRVCVCRCIGVKVSTQVRKRHRALGTLELDWQKLWATWQGCWEFGPSARAQHGSTIEPSLQPAFLFLLWCCGLNPTRGLLQVSHYWAIVLVARSFFHWVNIYTSIFSSLAAFICIYFEPGAFLVVSLGLGLWLYVPRSEEKWQVLSCWGLFSSATGSHTPENFCLTQQQNPVIVTYQSYRPRLWFWDF